MELHMHSHRLQARAPDWPAAAVAGFLAGAILMVLELLWSATVHADSPWSITHRIAAIVLGPDALRSSDFSVAVIAAALGTHYVLGILFGLVLAAVIAPFRFDSSAGMVLLTGALFSGLIYLFDFYVMVQAFPWFAVLRGWPTFVGHLLFGMSAAVIYWKLER